MEDFVWTPSVENIRASNVCRLMTATHMTSYEDLIQWSVANPARFWDAVMRDLSIKWETPYHTIRDTSEGLPWTKWFVGGKTNIVTNCIDRHLPAHENEIAVILESEDKKVQKMTYGKLHQEVSRLANALLKEGNRAGDVVGIYMPMSIEMVIIFYATLKIGAIVLPVFSGFAPEALATRLAHAESKILFTADGTQRRGKTVNIKQSADQAATQLPHLKRIVCLKHLDIDVDWDESRDCWYDDFVSGKSEHLPTQAVDSETPAIILYTSGTTGNPKGTVHSHGGTIAQVGKELKYHFDVKAEDRFFWLTDIGWMMGPWMIIGVHLQGGSIFLYDGAPNHPTADRLWEMIDRQKITHLGISPTAIRVLMRGRVSAIPDYSFNALRILGSTGEPWDENSYNWFFENIGKKRCPIINISGGTEIIGCFLAPLPIAPIKRCSLQGPGLGMDIDVVDDEANPVRGQTGHLVCRQPAPSMTRGFWKDKERYLNTYWSRWPNIWFHGDWAEVDKDGHWFLRGRSDDTINVAGRRVGPSEVESALIGHPDISEAAVIGIPDKLKGEAIAAFVVPALGADPDPQKMKAEVVSKLGKTFMPKSIIIVNALPKTRSAKIVRRAIRAKYLGKPLGDLSSIENPEALDGIDVCET